MIADEQVLRDTTSLSSMDGQTASSRRSVLRRPTKVSRALLPEAWRWMLVLTATAAVSIVLLGTSLLGAIYWQARAEQARPVDAIVVLGTAQYDGRPSPALKARLDTALTDWNEDLATYIVVTGGKQPGDRFTEAEASRNYLVDQGVPPSAILMESAGRNSWQSMQGAAAVLKTVRATSVLIVSDGFHLFRLKVMARELGMTPVARAATGSPIRPNSASELGYIVREAAATVIFLADKKL